jgi:hypothetical protein
MPSPDANQPSPAQRDTPRNFNELRDENRLRVDQPPLGHITLRARGSQQTVHLIRDISAHGVSLLLDEAVAPGEPVLLAQTLPSESPAGSPGSTHGAPPHPSHADPLHPEAGADHVYRAYVVWCRLQAADELQPGPHYIAGLRVFEPHALDHLVAASKG